MKTYRIYQIIVVFIILSLVTIASLSAQFEHEIYVDLSADANKLTGLVDNPRTEVDHRGLDFDAEVGVHVRAIGVYLFYGRFEAADYQNYGLGVDGYFIDTERLDVSAGAGISRILRRIPWGAYYEREVWIDQSGYANFHVRTVGTYWILENLGVSGRLQYQRRPDLEVYGIFEGAVGIKYKFNRG